MKPQANLDTGIITLHYSKNEPDEVSFLFSQIRTGQTEAFVVSPALIECFYQLAKFPGGIGFAEKCLIELYCNKAVKVIYIDQSLVIKAGIIKSQHRTELSLVDSTVIALSLNARMPLHTTEKHWKKMFPKLTLKMYHF